MRFCFDFIIYLKRVVHIVITKIFIKPIVFLNRGFFYFAIIPVYKFYLIIKNKFKDLFGLNQQSKLYLATHRRGVHIVLIVLAVITALTNFQIKETRAEVEFSRDILLAAIIDTKELGTLVEEKAGKAVPQVTSYGEEESFAIESTPGLDSVNLEKQAKDTIITTIQDESILVKPEIPSTKIVEELQDRQSPVAYIVKNGDSIEKIANQFGLKNSTILWENNLSSRSIIRPGDKLIIPTIDGISHIVKKNEVLTSIVKKYKGNLEQVINHNKLVDADDIGIGEKIFIPGGKKAVVYRPAKPKKPAISNFIPSATIVSKSGMIWPTDSRRITQYFSWRHPGGIDIGRNKSVDSWAPPIYASDDGVVKLSKSRGWNGGYGQWIIIDHGGGKTTRYAHLSKNLVKVGDRVKKGQVIALMGTTGRSTGVHLHFEIRFGSTKVNPLKYIK